MAFSAALERPTAPLVSVVVITYDHERWVREAIDSIFAQGHPADRLQVIVLDNGSTDDTPRILEAEYADRVELRLLDGLPLNEAVSLGQGMVVSEADFFTGLSGDDAWTPGRLQAMLDVFAHRPEVGVVYGDMEVVDGDGVLHHPSWRGAHGLPVHEGRMFGRLLERNLVFGPAVLMRTSLRPALLPVPAQAAWEDWWFATTAARIAPIAYLPAVVTRYRRHAGALSNVAAPEKRVAFLREDLRFRGWLLQNLATGEATPGELVTAVDQQLQGVLALATLTGRTADSALQIGGGQRRAAHAEQRIARRSEDPAERMTLLARAFGHDPSDLKLAARFSKAAGEADAVGARATASPVRPELVVADAHEHVTLVLAAELLADAHLLPTHLATLDPRTPRTLAIFGPGADPHALGERVALALAGAATELDVVLLDLPDSPSIRAALAVRATDLLTRDATPEWPWEGVRRCPATRPSAVPAV